ncbi:MAG: hypothetical protein WAM82_29390 [Thermoanaerobaculia bacterium]
MRPSGDQRGAGGEIHQAEGSSGLGQIQDPEREGLAVVLLVVAAGDIREPAAVRGDLYLGEGYLAQGKINVAEARGLEARRKSEEHSADSEGSSHGILPVRP